MRTLRVCVLADTLLTAESDSAAQLPAFLEKHFNFHALASFSHLVRWSLYC